MFREGFIFFHSCQSSPHPVTHLLHHTESCCFLLCCWKKSQVPLFWFINIFTPKCRAWKCFIMNETCYVCSLLAVFIAMWSFCLNMAQFRLYCLKMPFSYQMLQKNPTTSRIPVTLQLGEDWSVNLGLGLSSGMENEQCPHQHPPPLSGKVQPLPILPPSVVGRVHTNYPLPPSFHSCLGQNSCKNFHCATDKY